MTEQNSFSEILLKFDPIYKSSLLTGELNRDDFKNLESFSSSSGGTFKTDISKVLPEQSILKGTLVSDFWRNVYKLRIIIDSNSFNTYYHGNELTKQLCLTITSWSNNKEKHKSDILSLLEKKLLVSFKDRFSRYETVWNNILLKVSFHILDPKFAVSSANMKTYDTNGKYIISTNNKNDILGY